MRSLMQKYLAGTITDDHLVIESLHMVDPADPGLVLRGLPDPILHRILRFANEYPPGPMVTNYGVVPTKDQVIAALHWIEKSLQQKTSQPA